jgi:predicted subunit of tRNA(5-methylaminomethyl-2-thiouridylate) methyltransferase
MSGGVDSSVTAGLLVKQGYDVQGVSLRMWEGRLGPRVCSDHRGAKEVAEFLGIPHELLDLRSQFVETVVKPFAQEYLRGRTPNQARQPAAMGQAATGRLRGHRPLRPGRARQRFRAKLTAARRR